jgi:putative ABC transport system permease protein
MALRDLGGLTQTREATREVRLTWLDALLDSVWQDLRHTLRLARSKPGFTSIAVLSLALGTGANTAIFQLLDAVRLRTLPVTAPEEIVEIRVNDMTHARGSWLRETSLTNPLWEQIQKTQDAFSGLVAWADEPFDISTAGEFRKINALWVSGEFFRVLGVQPLIGGVFSPGDDHRGCGLDAGVVLSYGFWQRDFAGDRSIIGKEVSVGKFRTHVVGVTPPSFFGMEVGRTFDLAMPICSEPAWHEVNLRLDSGTVWWLTVMGRLKPGVSFQHAAERLGVLSPGIFKATLPSGYPTASVNPYLAMTLVPTSASHGLSRLRTQYSQPLALLLMITALVLLIACTNLAHLMLARMRARRRELAVRLSLGASASRLAQQLITESFLLALVGTVLGLLLARTMSRLLVTFLATSDAGVFLDMPMDLRTFGFATILSVISCIVFASLPVLRATRIEPLGAIRLAGPIVNATQEKPGRGLLASQIAVSFTLLVGTLLFVRSLWNLQTLDTGFQQSGIVVADVNFSGSSIPSAGVEAFRHEMLERIRSIPGVDGASEALILPLTRIWNNRAWADGSDSAQAREIMRNMIGTDYFHTLRTTLIAGREFSEQDMTPSAAKVAVVNERLARDLGLWPRPVGRHFWIDATPLEPRTSFQIVGVVVNTKYHDLRENDQPIMFVPLWQSALKRPSGQFMVRSDGDVNALISSLRTTLQGLDPAMRYSFRAFDTVVQDSFLRERLMATISGPFGILAVVLTALGLFGVISHTVARRTNEIAIRIAVGAQPRNVIGSIMREATVVLLMGLLGGTLLTLGLGRLVAPLLFGLNPYDPTSLVIAGLTLALVATCASYVPARRAASLNLMAALRQD